MFEVNSVEPINTDYGLYQGTPIARYFVNTYLSEVSPTISGLVLEFGWPTYAASIDCNYEILDIDCTNKEATVHGDICDPELGQSLADRYDAIICTAVLQLVSDPQIAVANMRTMLKPGGSLILAEKSISQTDPWSTNIDRWRFTRLGLELLMRDFSNLKTRNYGNVYTACAYLLGLPAEKINEEKLQYVDPRYPIVALAHGQK